MLLNSLDVSEMILEISKSRVQSTALCLESVTDDLASAEHAYYKE
jgi:hypothetical protein